MPRREGVVLPLRWWPSIAARRAASPPACAAGGGICLGTLGRARGGRRRQLQLQQQRRLRLQLQQQSQCEHGGDSSKRMFRWIARMRC
mmetsp:Transcript_44406/g.142328  ORF Transcript_44406/g.142328 Transcript_44406/m.142328 type:complete len:88 (-) Transcript_44406:1355-1618(-)